MATTGFGPTAIRSQKKDPVASSRAVLRTPGLVRAVSSAITRQSGRQANSNRFDMNLSDLFSETETKSQTMNRPSYGLQTSDSYTQSHTVEPHQQQYTSTLDRPMSQPVPDVYQQTLRPMAKVADLLDYDITVPTHPTTSPYSQHQHMPERLSPQNLSITPHGALPLLPEIQPSSSSGFDTGMSLPTHMSFDHDSYEVFNDADFEFHNLNSMIGGGGRGAAVWVDGGWSTGIAGAGGDDPSGVVVAGMDASVDMSSGLGHNTGNTGGNGTIDMFDGLFFG